MTWRSVYGPTIFDDNSGLGSPYTYVIRVPLGVIGDTDLLSRLVLRGPTSGSARVQAMWIGHALNDIDFTGDQVQVFVGGQSNFTLTNGITTTDSINFQMNGTNDVLIAYELLAGDDYRRDFLAPSGFKQSYKQTTNDAATENKSGYITKVGRIALVESIEVSAESDPPIEEPPSPEGPGNEMLLLSEAKAQKLFTGTAQTSGATGQRQHFQILNPSGSGVGCFCYEITITTPVKTVIELTSYHTELANAAVICNHAFQAGPALPKAKFSHEKFQTVQGNTHELIEIGPYSFTFRPNIWLDEGRGLAIALHQSNVDAVIACKWLEE